MSTEHNEPMRVEDEIDAALKMLSETEPPAALVSRMHRSLEVAAVSHRVRSSRWFLIPAAGMAMAALAMVAIFTQMHRTPEDHTVAVETARMATTAPLAQATIVPPSASVATKASKEGKRSARFSTERRNRRGRENRHATNLLSYPLTRQEKLLVRFAQTAKPSDLQMLNPEYQAKVEAQQEAEFAAYLKSGSNPSPQDSTQTNDSNEE
ncbi:MAG: hypothetical protein ACLQMO_16325 [Acidobacteriaceae bacterium]